MLKSEKGKSCRVEDLEALGRPTETIENSVQEVAQGKEAE